MGEGLLPVKGAGEDSGCVGVLCKCSLGFCSVSGTALGPGTGGGGRDLGVDLLFRSLEGR